MYQNVKHVSTLLNFLCDYYMSRKPQINSALRKYLRASEWQMLENPTVSYGEKLNTILRVKAKLGDMSRDGTDGAAPTEPELEPEPEQSVSIPEQSAPNSAASIPPAATSPAALAAGLIDKLKAGPGTTTKRPAACQSDAEPAPNEPKTKPPEAETGASCAEAAGGEVITINISDDDEEPVTATMDEPERTKPKRGRIRTGFSSRHQAKIHTRHAIAGCPLGSFPGVPRKATPYIGYKSFRIYTAMSKMAWRVQRRGSSEIPPDAHDNYLLCGTTAFRYHRIFLGASGCAFKRKILYWDSYMHCLGQDLTREAEQSSSAWSGGI